MSGEKEKEPYQSWSATNEIRFCEKSVPINGQFAQRMKVLQQKFQGNLGGEKWEDVPTVKED